MKYRFTIVYMTIGNAPAKFTMVKTTDNPEAHLNTLVNTIKTQRNRYCTRIINSTYEVI